MQIYKIFHKLRLINISKYAGLVKAILHERTLKYAGLVKAVLHEKTLKYAGLVSAVLHEKTLKCAGLVYAVFHKMTLKYAALVNTLFHEITRKITGGERGAGKTGFRGCPRIQEIKNFSALTRKSQEALTCEA